MKFSSEIVVKVLITLSAPHLRQRLWATVHALHLIIDPANTGPDPLFDDRLFAGPVGEEIDHLADDNRGLGFGAARFVLAAHLGPHRPDIFRKAHKFLLYQDFTFFKLGLEPTIDYSLAGRNSHSYCQRR